tara:strand:+ start:7357 stop:7761 length:405 start_codon:yes stop_codon:yes gene_type:complete
MKDRFNNWRPPAIIEGKLNKYNWIVQNKDRFKLGKKVDIGSFTYINAKNNVIIEDYVQIGSHCSIYSVSTIDDNQGEVVLRKNSKIGSHSTVLPNVEIGENSIIGAHSLVNKNIPANVVAYGIPAKIIREINEK